MNDDDQHLTPDVDDAALRALAQHLGKDVAERVDVERVAASVLTGLRRPAVTPLRHPRVVPRWLRAAAAVVVLLGGAFVARQLVMRAPTHLVQEDLAGLDAPELAELLETLDQTLDLSSPAVGNDLDGLNESQLEAILRSLEG